MSRTKKDPDLRRQEILDTAVELFGTQGYEKTTITDIARKLNMSQGLCYRYFSSKEAIFDAALDHYADYFVSAYRAPLNDKSLPVKERLARVPGFMELEQKNDAYYQFYHHGESKQFHNLLALKVCDKMQTVILELLVEEWGDEVKGMPSKTLASFLVYGQLGILLDEELSGSEKITRIRSFIEKILVL